ncbi:hypothetical protein [Cyanobium sp. CH-040]|uniref:hypothetical protein n=1 Tax=Cyanobium sp. CH-040 TaxID=2823708 RepID=UPI0020CCFB0C|nr:hypothetical protein [Cyanobium sp. CH-040]MCP9926746.1 hypothetical protein [Cyanobium sp. CH-040]
MNSKVIIDELMKGNENTAFEMSRKALLLAYDREKKDIIYVEPRMTGGSGHFERLAVCYTSLLEKYGYSVEVVGAYQARSTLPSNWKSAIPIPDHCLSSGKIVSEVQSLAFRNYWKRTTDYILACSEQTPRLALFPTSRYLTIAGTLHAIEDLRDVKGGIFGVMETFPAPDCDNPEIVKSEFSHAASIVAQSSKSYIFLAESPQIRKFLIQCGFDHGSVTVHPYPASSRFSGRNLPHQTTERVRIGCIGGSRSVQNPGILARYFTEYQQFSNVQWITKLNLDLACTQSGLNKDEILCGLKSNGVQNISQRLDDVTYDEIMTSLDIMIMPYADRYRTIGSGIFLECISAGVIPLVPMESTMRRLYEDLGGLAPAIQDISPNGIHQSITEALDSISSLRGNAICVQENWLNHENGALAWEKLITGFATTVLKGD